MRFFPLIIVVFFSVTFASAQKYSDQIDDTIYQMVDTPPEFPNGDQEMYEYIAEKLTPNLQRLQEDRLAREGYYTILKFVVDKNGEIHDLQADNRSNHYYLVDDLAKIFEGMPEWQPGQVAEKPVNTLVYLELDMSAQNGEVHIRYHPLFPDSVTWVRNKMTKKQKTWAAIAAVVITGVFVLIASGKL